MCIYVCACVYVCVVCVCIWRHGVCMHVCRCICVYVGMCVGMCVSMCMCTYVYVCMYMCVGGDPFHFSLPSNETESPTVGLVVPQDLASAWHIEDTRYLLCK